MCYWVLEGWEEDRRDKSWDFPKVHEKQQIPDSGISKHPGQDKYK